MNIIQTKIQDILIVQPDIFGDNRGFFMESWHKQRYIDAGITSDFVQDNISFSTFGILRGLHFQYKNAQAKLVQVLKGEVYDVAVDIRRGSPTFGQYVSVILSGENKKQMFIPKGFAHGFCVLSENALFMYKCSDYYNAQNEAGIFWSDSDIAIDWPVKEPCLSEKDIKYPKLKDIQAKILPQFTKDTN